MAKTLNFKQTRGTKTYHLPFRRSSLLGPEMTLMVRRLENGSFEAGVSVCSLHEPFVKRTGRLLAYHRLNGKPFQGVTAEEVIGQVEIHLHALNEHRPDTLTAEVFNDLASVQLGLDEAFDILDKNRDAKLLGNLAEDEACGC